MNSPRPAGPRPGRRARRPTPARPAKGPRLLPRGPSPLFSAGSAITSERICCLLETIVPAPGRGAGGHGLAEGATVVAHPQPQVGVLILQKDEVTREGEEPPLAGEAIAAWRRRRRHRHEPARVLRAGQGQAP